MDPNLTQAEGFILGVGAKMFTIAGPVIVYGVSASVVYGLIYWITTLLQQKSLDRFGQDFLFLLTMLKSTVMMLAVMTSMVPISIRSPKGS